MMLHTSVIKSITITGTMTLLDARPRLAFFRIFIPCVKGIMSAIFWSVAGIISYGNVAPEKISIGKYKRLAIIPAVFGFFETPPAIIPMLNIVSITKKYPARNSARLPFILKPKKQKATMNRLTKDASA